MSKSEYLPRFSCPGKNKLGSEMFPERSAWERPDARDSTQPVRNKADEAIHARRVIAGRFALDQLTNERYDLTLMLPRVTKERIHDCYNSVIPKCQLP
jgi:hypothetical protein